MTTYYHNPRCSKSRQGLEILTQAKISFTIKEYLKEPLAVQELEDLFLKLGKSPKEVVRTKEDLYKELGLDQKELSSREWIEVIIENPKLLERPLFVYKEKAVIGRPPENISQLLSNVNE